MDGLRGGDGQGRRCLGESRKTGRGVAGDMGLEEYIDRLTQELHARVEHQRLVFERLLGARCNGHASLTYCPLVRCPRLEKLRSTLRETIAVLEETKASFRSKRLEVLRKKLTDILAGC